MTEPEEPPDSETESFLGPLSIIGALSLCCVGFGAIAGGAAITGGTAAGTAVAIGATSARGTLVSLVVTAMTVFVVAVVARWYTNR